MGITKLYENWLSDEKGMGNDMDMPKLSNRQMQGRTRVQDEDTIVMDTPEWLVAIPHTYRAAMYWTNKCGANWDTGAKSQGDRFFNMYNEQGPLFIIQDKVGGNCYQLHIEAGILVDGNGGQVNCSDIFPDNPELYDAIFSHISRDQKEMFYNMCGM
jgi:hypothetical protein